MSPLNLLPEEDPQEFDEELVVVGPGPRLIPEEVIPAIRFNWSYIRTHYHLGNKIEDIYVIRLQSQNENEVALHCSNIFLSLDFTCRANVSFSFILNRKGTNEYRVFYASRNTGFFEEFKFILGLDHVKKFIDEIKRTDLWEHVSKQSPDTKWKVHSIISMTMYIGKLKYRLE